MATLKPLKINFTDQTKQPITINPYANDRQSTSLSLHGTGSEVWGQSVNQALLQLLENFSSPNEPENPVEGQLWFDSLNKKLNFADSSLSWIPVDYIYQSDTPPPSQSTGKLWFDTTVNQLKCYNGTTYQSVADDRLLLSGGTVTGNMTVDGKTTINSTLIINVNGTCTDLTLVDSLKFATDSKIVNNNSTNTFLLKESNDNDIKLKSHNNITIDSTDSITIKHNINRVDPDNTNLILQMTDSQITFGSDINMSVNGKILNTRYDSTNTALVPYGLLQTLNSRLPDYVDRNGDTMSGSLTSDVNDSTIIPYTINDSILFTSNNTSAVTKMNVNSGAFQVTDTTNNEILMSIDMNTGQFDAKDKRIVNVRWPDQYYDLANKQYLDAKANDLVSEGSSALTGQPTAWVSFNPGKASPYKNGNNIGTLIKQGTGKFKVVFDTPMSSTYYVTITNVSENRVGGSRVSVDSVVIPESDDYAIVNILKTRVKQKNDYDPESDDGGLDHYTQEGVHISHIDQNEALTILFYDLY